MGIMEMSDAEVGIGMVLFWCIAEIVIFIFGDE